MKPWNALLYIFPLLLLQAVSSQASFEQSTAVGVEESKQKTFSVAHSLSARWASDAFDTNEQQVINQGLFYGSTIFYKKQFYIGIGLGASSVSVDNNFFDRGNGVFELSDLSLSLGTTGYSLYRRTKKESLTLYTNLRSRFPVSEVSRNEGYNAVPSGSLDLAYHYKSLDLLISGSQTYVMNSFDTNLNGFANLESASFGSLTARWNVNRYRIQASYRAGLLNYTDGTTRGRSGNSLSLTAIFKGNMWAAVSTSNVSNVQDQFVDVWFIDPFQRFYSLSTGVTF